MRSNQLSYTSQVSLYSFLRRWKVSFNNHKETVRSILELLEIVSSGFDARMKIISFIVSSGVPDVTK